MPSWPQGFLVRAILKKKSFCAKILQADLTENGCQDNQMESVCPPLLTKHFLCKTRQADWRSAQWNLITDFHQRPPCCCPFLCKHKHALPRPPTLCIGWKQGPTTVSRSRIRFQQEAAYNRTTTTTHNRTTTTQQLRVGQQQHNYTTICNIPKRNSALQPLQYLVYDLDDRQHNHKITTTEKCNTKILRF